MPDISRTEMGLIIGLVIGTLFLAFLVVLAYIVYDRQKERLYRFFNFIGPQDQPRTGPPGGGGGQNWTTINNSMIGLEIHSDMFSGNYGHESDQQHPPSERANGGGLSDADRKSCLTVLFDWDPRLPLPPPFRTFEGLAAHGSIEEEGPEMGSDASLPIRAEFPPIREEQAGEVELHLAPEDEVPPLPYGGAVAAGAPPREPVVSLRLRREPNFAAIGGVVGASDGTVVTRAGSPQVSMRLDPDSSAGPSQAASMSQGSEKFRSRSLASSAGGAPLRSPISSATLRPTLDARGLRDESVNSTGSLVQRSCSLGGRPTPSSPLLAADAMGAGRAAAFLDVTASVYCTQGIPGPVAEGGGSNLTPVVVADAEAHVASNGGSKSPSAGGATCSMPRSIAMSGGGGCGVSCDGFSGCGISIGGGISGGGGCASSQTERERSTGRMDVRCFLGFATSGVAAAIGAS